MSDHACHLQTTQEGVHIWRVGGVDMMHSENAVPRQNVFHVTMEKHFLPDRELNPFAVSTPDR